MISINIRKIFQSLGYRLIAAAKGDQSDFYGKPVGTNLFTLSQNDDKIVWQNCFRTLKGDVAVMKSETLPFVKYTSEQILDWIKQIEGYAHLTPQCPSNFQFNTLEEALDDL